MSAAFTDQISTFAARRASQLVLWAIAIVLLALFGSQLLRLWQSVSFTPIVENESPITAANPRREYSASAITERNLFGRYTANPETLQRSNLPTTSLQVVLRGVFTSTNPANASAIIERPDGEVRSYRVNAVVYGNTRLHAVFNDRIVLYTQGELETLYFPQPDDTAQPDSGTMAAAMDQIPTDIRNLVESTMSPEEIREAREQLTSGSMSPDQRAELIRQRLLDLRKRAREKKQ